MIRVESNAKRVERLSIELLHAELALGGLQDLFARLEKLVNVGTTRLDLHAQRLGVLEDDVENLK